MFQKADPDHMLSHGTTYVRILGGLPNTSASGRGWLLQPPGTRLRAVPLAIEADGHWLVVEVLDHPAPVGEQV